MKKIIIPNRSCLSKPRNWLLLKEAHILLLILLCSKCTSVIPKLEYPPGFSNEEFAWHSTNSNFSEDFSNLPDELKKSILAKFDFSQRNLFSASFLNSLYTLFGIGKNNVRPITIEATIIKSSFDSILKSVATRSSKLRGGMSASVIEARIIKSTTRNERYLFFIWVKIKDIDINYHEARVFKYEKGAWHYWKNPIAESISESGVMKSVFTNEQYTSDIDIWSPNDKEREFMKNIIIGIEKYISENNVVFNEI